MRCLCYDRKVGASPPLRYPWVRYRLYTLLPGRWTGGCSLLHWLNVLNAADSFPTGLIKYTLHYTDNTQLYLITVSQRLFHCSSLRVNYVSSLLSLWAGHKCVKQTPHLCWCSLSVVLTLKRFKSAAPGEMWRQRGGRGFPEPSKAEQRPGPLPVLLLLSRLDILVKPSNNAEFSLGSCFYHLFKGWGKTKLYELENPSEEGASKRNAVTHEPEVFLLVLKKGCTSCPSEQEETV